MATNLMALFVLPTSKDEQDDTFKPVELREGVNGQVRN